MKLGMIVIVIVVVVIMIMVMAVMVVLVMVSIRFAMGMAVVIVPMVIMSVMVLTMVMCRILRGLMVMRVIMGVLMPVFSISGISKTVTMGIGRGQLTAASPVKRYPLGRIQDAQGGIQSLALGLVTGRVFKSNQVDTGNGELQPKLVAIHGEVASRFTMHVSTVLTQGFGVGRCTDRQTGGQGNNGW